VQQNVQKSNPESPLKDGDANLTQPVQQNSNGAELNTRKRALNQNGKFLMYFILEGRSL
jgi:hypothetical protein